MTEIRATDQVRRTLMGATDEIQGIVRNYDPSKYELPEPERSTVFTEMTGVMSYLMGVSQVCREGCLRHTDPIRTSYENAMYGCPRNYHEPELAVRQKLKEDLGIAVEEAFRMLQESASLTTAKS